MKDAEAVVTDTYGMFVQTDDYHEEGQEFNDHLVGLGIGPMATSGAPSSAGNGGSADGSRTVAV